METTALNELVSQRQYLCEIKGICIDVEQRKIKGYTKAKFFHSREAPPHNEHEFLKMSKRLSGQFNSPASIPTLAFDNKAATITSFHLQDTPKSGILRVPLRDILKEIGIDYVE